MLRSSRLGCCGVVSWDVAETMKIFDYQVPITHRMEEIISYGIVPVLFRYRVRYRVRYIPLFLSVKGKRWSTLRYTLDLLWGGGSTSPLVVDVVMSSLSLYCRPTAFSTGINSKQ